MDLLGDTYLEIADDTPANIGFAVGDFAMTLTVLPRLYTTEVVKLVSYVDETAGSEAGFSLEYVDMHFVFKVKLSSDAAFLEIVTVDQPIRRWMSLAVSFSSTDGELKFYVGGTQESADTQTVTGVIEYPTTGKFLVAGADAELMFDGKIKDFRVYDSALTSAELFAITETCPGGSFRDDYPYCNVCPPGCPDCSNIDYTCYDSTLNADIPLKYDGADFSVYSRFLAPIDNNEVTFNVFSPDSYFMDISGEPWGYIEMFSEGAAQHRAYYNAPIQELTIRTFVKLTKPMVEDWLAIVAYLFDSSWMESGYSLGIIGG